MNDRKLNNQNVLCIHCGYDTNPAKATHCQVCGKHLGISLVQNSNEVTKPQPKPSADWLFTPWMIRLVFVLLFLLLSWAIYSLFRSVSDQKNSDGIAAYSSSDSTQNTSDVKLYNSMKDVSNVPEGIFNYSGGISFAALTAHGLNEAITKAHPNFRLRYTEPRDGKPGGRKGVAMLLDSELSFTLQGAPLKDVDYSKAKERGFGLKQVPFALDAVIFFIHPDISIPGLSVEQLKDIYKGKLTNWKQAGGPDQPIVPFVRDPKASNLLDELLRKEVGQVSPKVQFIRDHTEAIRKVASTPGGISFGGNAPIVGQRTIRPLAIAKANSQQYVQPFINDGKQINAAVIRDGSYPITRRMFIVFRQDATIDQLAGEAYVNMLLSKEGQQIVEKARLVPLR